MKQITIICLMWLTSQTLFAQVTQDYQIAEWERAKVYTKEYLDAMPEDGYKFKPTPEMRSFAEQMDHLADANFAMAAAASGQKSPMTGSAEKMPDQSKAAVTKVVLDSYDFMIASIKATPAADYGKAIKLFGMDTKSGIAFDKAFEHQTHHRGQTTVYIRLKGVKPPQEKLF
ncbi:DinB family protein [Dyadobacter psychrotolerans]|uniref:Damage-inducible protein DinB n=1 Tax=Dyadobacter psychrotolerans TaxID=2541721 RepID=A0A4R5DVW2_9BACT|nr:DinB family protein [Dyadobacter psychrotolerans]TDE18609.1 damage-inducible protein DinB [Dyadobacter psychrotolerans]